MPRLAPEIKTVLFVISISLSLSSPLVESRLHAAITHAHDARYGEFLFFERRVANPDYTTTIAMNAHPCSNVMAGGSGNMVGNSEVGAAESQ